MIAEYALVLVFGSLLGAIKSGRYRNNHPVEFDLPSDWTIEGTHPSADNGDVVILKQPSFVGAFAAVWMTRDKTAQAGRQALPVTHYEDNGVKMSQSTTWIVTEHTRVFVLRARHSLRPADFPNSFRSDYFLRGCSLE